MRRRLLLGSAMVGLLAGAARVDVVLSMNDNQTVLDDKANQVAPNPVKPDTVDVIDVGSFPPRIVSTLEVPGSVVGPPLAIWVAPDESWAIVTAATKADPQGKFGTSPDDRASVIDLKASPPRMALAIQRALERSGRLAGSRDYPAHEGTHVSSRQIRNAFARACRYATAV